MSYANRSENLQREIDDAIARGWKIESETPERVVLVKRNVGNLAVHLILAVLTGWWSFGLVNLVYGGYKYLNDAQRRVVREGTACPECGASVSPDASYCQNCGTELPGPPVEAEAETGTESETTRAS
ncbi:zinc ribbon domain-containing protein [Halorussus limi]|uniref:Zinc ribbon domain-containing protein n=1 Tax=Halorussus limi TaxID=2938695 RepID=A0A8U0HPI6_9EURY|nr:zinc ribbon domain-containing protein [Halorussus limi]UPV72952.1 zinc ribbon domain-containing protein [Halorussus limi]